MVDAQNTKGHTAQLAQANLAWMRYALDDTRMAEMYAGIDRINRLGDESVWPLLGQGEVNDDKKGEEGDWTVTKIVWGLAYKPRTDDIGQSPAISLVSSLLDAGAIVRAYDPRAMDNARAMFGERVTFCESMYDAADGADVLALVTEWHQFRRPDFGRLRGSMRGNLLVDGRNVWEPAELEELGFRYVAIGRRGLKPRSVLPGPPRDPSLRLSLEPAVDRSYSFAKDELRIP